jgi:hypothetical protein
MPSSAASYRALGGSDRHNRAIASVGHLAQNDYRFERPPTRCVRGSRASIAVRCTRAILTRSYGRESPSVNVVYLAREPLRMFYF